MPLLFNCIEVFQEILFASMPWFHPLLLTESYLKDDLNVGFYLPLVYLALRQSLTLCHNSTSFAGFTLNMGQRESAFTVEEENFYKVSHIVLDEIPTKLRDFFKMSWDTKYPAYPWIDTPACGQRFLNAERNVQKHIRPHIALGDRKEWDGTTLFAVLLFSSLNLIQKNTPAYQAIDNLRAVRNNHYGHLNCARIDTPAYQQITSNVQTSFATLNWATNGISAIEQRNVLKGDGVRLLKVMQEEKARNDALEKRVCNVENDVIQQQIVTAQLQTDVTQLEAESMQLKTGTAMLQSDMAQVRADSVQLQGDVVQLQTDVDTAHIGIRQLGKDMGKIWSEQCHTFSLMYLSCRSSCRRNLGKIIVLH